MQHNSYISHKHILFLISMTKQTKSKAIVKDIKTVEVTDPNGEVFQILCQIGGYISEEHRKYELHILEEIFDRNYSEDKEQMINNIWRDAILNGIHFLGMDSGNRASERIRIGKKIRQIRTERGIEARDLAKLSGIDAANLSRIENGKYSVGIDILSKIAASLGKKIDLVNI